MLRDLRKKADNVQEQMSNVSTETETLRKIPKEVLEIKNILTEIKNGDFPGGAVVTTPHSQCKGPGFDSWSGN